MRFYGESIEFENFQQVKLLLMRKRESLCTIITPHAAGGFGVTERGVICAATTATYTIHHTQSGCDLAFRTERVVD